MTPLYVSLAVLAAILAAIYATALWRTQSWKQGGTLPPLRGLALPEGSIRGLIAFLVVGAFVIFVFFGTRSFPEDKDLYTTVLTAFATLTGAVTGFYFGGRGSQAGGKPPSEEQSDRS